MTLFPQKFRIQLGYIISKLPMICSQIPSPGRGLCDDAIAIASYLTATLRLPGLGVAERRHRAPGAHLSDQFSMTKHNGKARKAGVRVGAALQNRKAKVRNAHTPPFSAAAAAYLGPIIIRLLPHPCRAAPSTPAPSSGTPPTCPMARACLSGETSMSSWPWSVWAQGGRQLGLLPRRAPV